MRQDAWRAYLEMALGVTEASRKKATKVAKRLVGKGGVTAEQIQGLADDVLKASAANREAVTRIVRAELDRALGAVGLAKADEVAALTARVHELESQLRQRPAPEMGGDEAVLDETGGAPPAAPAKPATPATPAARAAPAKPAMPATPAMPAKKTVAKKAVAKKAVAAKPAKATATKATATKATVTATKAAATKTAATKATATKATATKTAAKKAVAKKTAAGGGSTP